MEPHFLMNHNNKKMRFKRKNKDSENTVSPQSKVFLIDTKKYKII